MTPSGRKYAAVAFDEAAWSEDMRNATASAREIATQRREQLERDGTLIDKHPLLIQKTLADKLSDKISVIIAPPPAAGGFIGQALIDGARRGTAAGTAAGGSAP